MSKDGKTYDSPQKSWYQFLNMYYVPPYYANKEEQLRNELKEFIRNIDNPIKPKKELYQLPSNKIINKLKHRWSSRKITHPRYYKDILMK
jgi:hypothetical protein